MVRSDMENSYIGVNIWGKMISIELVQKHGIIFAEVRWGNDVKFSTLCSYYSGKNVDICSDLLYCATIRKNSVVTEKNTEENVMCRLNVALWFDRFVCKHHMQMAKQFIDYPSRSFSYLSQMRQFGEKAYRKAKIHYLKHACFSVLLKDFGHVLRFRVRHMLP